MIQLCKYPRRNELWTPEIRHRLSRKFMKTIDQVFFFLTIHLQLDLVCGKVAVQRIEAVEKVFGSLDRRLCATQIGTKINHLARKFISGADVVGVVVGQHLRGQALAECSS